MERNVSDSAARKAITVSIVSEDANAECKEVIRPLRARSASIDEWIRYTVDARPLSLDMTLIGEAATRGLETTQILNVLILVSSLFLFDFFQNKLQKHTN